MIFILPESINSNEQWRRIVKFDVTIDRDEEGFPLTIETRQVD